MKYPEDQKIMHITFVEQVLSMLYIRTCTAAHFSASARLASARVVSNLCRYCIKHTIFLGMVVDVSTYLVGEQGLVNRVARRFYIFGVCKNYNYNYLYMHNVYTREQPWCSALKLGSNHTQAFKTTVWTNIGLRGGIPGSLIHFSHSTSSNTPLLTCMEISIRFCFKTYNFTTSLWKYSKRNCFHCSVVTVP